MAVVDELISILGYRIQGQENLRKFQRGMDDAEKKARSSAKAFSGLGRSVGGALAGLGAGSAVKAAITRFAEFERTLTRVGITAGASAEETAKASQAVQRMAQDFALPIDQAVAGLDTLTSSGKSLEEAMEFLPAVLATAQASGAATEDIANTALKSADALKIETKELQKAFDIMVTGGKAGQFELRDMAQYIPDLANGFAALGYKGTDGLKRLIAVMQTLRQRTGNASSAADQARNIFTKIYSADTSEKFKKFGINLNAELSKARASGKDILQTFIDLTNKAVNGDLSKLPLLFTDQEFLAGMRTLASSPEALQRFLTVLNGADVNGAVFRDLNRILENTQAKIDTLGVSWDRFMTALGGAASGRLGGAMDWATERLAYTEAIHEGLKKEGLTDVSARNMRVLELQVTFNDDELNRLARLGGFVPSSANSRYSEADTRLSPLQIERRRLETARAKMVADEKALQDAINAPGTMPGSYGVAMKQRELRQIELRKMENTSAINRTYPVDPDRHQRFIGSQPAPPMPPSRPDAAASVINDNRQDNRQFPVTNNVTINQTVQQVTEAPAAAASATAGAVKQALQPQPARMHFEGR